jgi:hypothetical protein
MKTVAINRDDPIEPHMSGGKAALIHRIEQQPLGFVREKLMADGKITATEWNLVSAEFQKFVYLVGSGVYPMAMISPKIDELCHQFLMFTREYRKFCSETVGFFIHHTPETEVNPIPLKAANNLVAAYERNFGPLPPIWLEGLDENNKLLYTERPLKNKPPVKWSGWTGPEESSKP